MITIYKKVEKTKENPIGIVTIDNIEELDKPFLLCLSAQNNEDKSIYGLIRTGVQAARTYTTQEDAARFKIDEMPVDFLGLRFKGDENYRKNYEEIADKFIIPFLIDEEKDIEKIRKRARKINFMTYCDGTNTYKRIEQKVIEKLLSLGFNDDEIDSIVSQISLIAVGTMVDTSDLKATTTTFVDINDEEIANNNTINYQQLLKEKNKKVMFGTYGRSNNLLYIYDGSGEHELKEYLIDDVLVKPSLCSVVYYLLQNSIQNVDSNELKPLSAEDILNILKKYTSEEKNSKEMMDELDNSIEYKNTSKYSKEEAKMRRELDQLLKDIVTIKKELSSSLNREKTAKDNYKLLMDSINKLCSETTLYQIFNDMGWQLSPDKTAAALNEPTDKEIREEYNNMKKYQKTI